MPLLIALSYLDFLSNKIPKAVLLATKDAKLQHHVRGSPPIIFYDSMKIREELKVPEGEKKPLK